MRPILGIYLLIGLLMACANAGAAVARQDLEELRSAVAAFVENHYTGHAKDLSIEVNRLDPRLKLTDCEQPLAFEVRDLSANGGSISVKTECQGKRPWSVYVRAQVDLYRDILVAAHSLERGQRLTRAAITLKERNTSELRQGYYIEPGQVLGQQLRRRVDPGEPLRSGLLEQPMAVKRGQMVTLESRSGAISVVTQAEALSSGRIGEQIRVENASSERVIHANIVAESHVEAVF